MNKKLKRLLAIISTILILVLTSCRSNDVKSTYVVRTCYDVPPLYFYDFPLLKNAIVIPLDENGEVVKVDSDRVVNCVIPWWYVQSLAEFYLHYQETRKSFEYYKQIKEEYKSTNK